MKRDDFAKALAVMSLTGVVCRILRPAEPERFGPLEALKASLRRDASHREPKRRKAKCTGA